MEPAVLEIPAWLSLLEYEALSAAGIGGDARKASHSSSAIRSQAVVVLYLANLAIEPEPEAELRALRQSFELIV